MNRAHGWTDYQERLGRVVAYIHDHLAEELRLDQLAEVAHLSPYHWHRVYHAMHGETIASTIRRLRLQRGSAYLANSALPVAQIARLCGYPSSQSFARAFRADYGVSPVQYREHGSHTVFRAGPARPEAAGYTVQVREAPRVRLAGLNHKGSYMEIGKAFEAAHGHLAAQGLAQPATRWLAVYDDDPFAVPQAQLWSRAGLSLPPGALPQPPLLPFELGGELCAVLRHQGPYATMRAAYQWLYGQWLVQAGREPANLPVFEEYLNNPRDTAPSQLLTDIHLPLKR